MAKPTDRILELLLEVHPKPLSGGQIGRICGLGSWRLYPTLARLEQQKLIMSDFANEPWPRRRMYLLYSRNGNER